MEQTRSCGRIAQSGLILLMPCASKASAGENPAREALLAEGFRRMHWPAYDASLVRRTEYGKPVYDAGGPYFFNYSDTKGWCGGVFAPVQAGIDLEGVRSRPPALLKRLPEAEQICLYEAADETERQRRFARMWTAKEAFCKMTGNGITKEILETSFAGCIARTKPPFVSSEGDGYELPAEAAAAVCACGTQGMLAQFYAGSLTISVCTAHECRFDVAFFDPVG